MKPIFTAVGSTQTPDKISDLLPNDVVWILLYIYLVVVW